MSFAERSFYELNPQTKFISSPHIELLVSRLEACRAGKIRRLIVNLPPRSLKSHAVSVVFPAWVLGHDPTAQIICASYGQDLADKHARDSRILMASAFYRRLFPNTCLSTEKQSISEFMTTGQGFRMSTSVNGVLTGRGADLIILDDPLKPDDAFSETRRPAVNEWYDHSLISRLNNKGTGTIIIVMQRLHQDDLVGHVMEQEKWDVLRFPAIAEEDENLWIEGPLGKRRWARKKGEALQPDREPLFVLANIRQTIGTYNFESQYQQSPTPVGGAIIQTQWLKRYDENDSKEFVCILQSWDTANKSGEINDYSVCTTWGMLHEKYYLLDVFRKRLDYPQLKRAVKEQAEKHKAHTILIEDKASGTQLIQDLKNDGVCGIEGYEAPTGTDKTMRLYAQAAEFEAGHVLLPSSAPWVEDYVRELTSFPGSKYDDQVDSTTQALDHLKNKCSIGVWLRL